MEEIPSIILFAIYFILVVVGLYKGIVYYFTGKGDKHYWGPIEPHFPRGSRIGDFLGIILNIIIVVFILGVPLFVIIDRYL